MNNIDYNNYLLNLHRDCAMSSLNGWGVSLYEVNNKFNNLADIFNNSIATQLLNNLSVKHKHNSIFEKMDDYPSMFFQTNAGKGMVTQDLQTLNEGYFAKLNKMIEEYQNSPRILPSDHSDYKIKTFNANLNAGMGNYETYGEGIFKSFARDSLKLHLAFESKVDTVRDITDFTKKLVKNLEQAHVPINADLSIFPQYVQKIFKNTCLAKEINAIDFDHILKLAIESNKPKNLIL